MFSWNARMIQKLSQWVYSTLRKKGNIYEKWVILTQEEISHKDALFWLKGCHGGGDF